MTPRGAARRRLRGDRRPHAGTRRGPSRRSTRSYVFTLRFPEQEFKLARGRRGRRPEDGERRRRSSSSTRPRATLRVKRGKTAGETPPRVADPGQARTAPTRRSTRCFAFAERVAARGLEPCGASTPRSTCCCAARRGSRRGRRRSDRRAGRPRRARRAGRAAWIDSALVIQGPPGSGKTYTGARLAVDLMRHGQARRRRRHVAQGDRQPARARSTTAPTRSGFDFRRLEEGSDDAGERLRRATASPRRRRRRPDDGGRRRASARHRLAVGARGHARGGRRALRRRGRPDVARRRDRRRAGRTQRRAARRPAAARARQPGHPPARLRRLGARPPARRARHRRRRTAASSSTARWRHAPRRLPLRLATRCTTARLDSDRRTASASGSISPGLSGTGLRLLEVEHADNRQRAPEEVAGDPRRRSTGCSPAAAGPTATATTATADARRHPRRRALQRPGPMPARTALPDGARRHRRQVPGPGGAGRLLLDDQLERRRRPARAWTSSSSRNRLNVAVSRAQALAVVVCSPAPAGRALRDRRADAARQHAVPVRRHGDAPMKRLGHEQ